MGMLSLFLICIPFILFYLYIFCDISLAKISRTVFVDYSLFGTMLGIVYYILSIIYSCIFLLCIV